MKILVRFFSALFLFSISPVFADVEVEQLPIPIDALMYSNQFFVSSSGLAISIDETNQGSPSTPPKYGPWSAYLLPTKSTVSYSTETVCHGVPNCASHPVAIDDTGTTAFLTESPGNSTTHCFLFSISKEGVRQDLMDFESIGQCQVNAAYTGEGVLFVLMDLQRAGTKPQLFRIENMVQEIVIPSFNFTPRSFEGINLKVSKNGRVAGQFFGDNDESFAFVVERDETIAHVLSFSADGVRQYILSINNFGHVLVSSVKDGTENYSIRIFDLATHTFISPAYPGSMGGSLDQESDTILSATAEREIEPYEALLFADSQEKILACALPPTKTFVMGGYSNLIGEAGVDRVLYRYDEGTYLILAITGIWKVSGVTTTQRYCVTNGAIKGTIKGKCASKYVKRGHFNFDLKSPLTKRDKRSCTYRLKVTDEKGRAKKGVPIRYFGRSTKAKISVTNSRGIFEYDLGKEQCRPSISVFSKSLRYHAVSVEIGCRAGIKYERPFKEAK